MRGFLSEDDCRKYNIQFILNVPMSVITCNQHDFINVKKPGIHIEIHDLRTMDIM